MADEQASSRSSAHIAVIGDEVTVAEVLRAGVGNVDPRKKINYLVVDNKTPVKAVEDAFKEFTNREDIVVVLISQNIANMIRLAIDGYHKPLPAILEINSKDHADDPSQESILSRVKHVLSGEIEVKQRSTPFSGDIPSPRSSYSATVVKKKVFLFGGHGKDSAVNDVHILDMETGTWTIPTILGEAPTPRYAHTAAILKGGDRILIYGGYTNTAESDIWLLEVDSPYVRSQKELHGKDVVAWSKGICGESPQPVVICGPSGVGKGTLIGKLIKEFPQKVGFSVSHTTRRPRESEENGVHYFFTQRAVMEKEVKEGKFLESADVHGNLYGTSIAAVEAVADSGKTCILDIDVQGAESVKKSPLNAKFIFINPPSFEELEARLRGRGTESEEQIQKRLKNAKGELARSSDAALFDYVVVNDDIETAYVELKKILGLSTLASENGFHRHEEFYPEGRSGHFSSVFESKILIYGGVTNGGAATNDLLILDTSKLSGGSPASTRGLSWSRLEPKVDFLDYLLPALTLSARCNQHVILPSAAELLLTGGCNGKQA